MRERSSSTFAANYALVILIEVVVIGVLWFAGRYFG